MPLPVMTYSRLTSFTAMLGLAVALLPAPARAQTPAAAAVPAAARTDQPLLAPWGGPHGGGLVRDAP